MKIATTEQMRQMDRYAIEKLLIREEILMENAGIAATTILAKESGLAGKRIVVVCGTGNNGGDGLVVARLAHSLGGVVSVFIVGNQDRFRGAARLNWDIVQRLPLTIRPLGEISDLEEELKGADYVVDALFGTGLDRKVTGLYADAIRAINRKGKNILSLDIPSGVNGDTGQVMGEAVEADWTVTFGLPKIGNILYPGYGLCGKLFVCHIAFPPTLYNAPDLTVQLNGPIRLPKRSPQAHKGSLGEALFIAGAKTYYGAPLFAALSFLKAGGGYARLALPASLAPALAAQGSEIVFLPQEETPTGSLGRGNRTYLQTMAEKMDIVVIGPGLSLEPETQELVRELTSSIGKPLIIDGDGLTALADHTSILKNRTTPAVLTPHLGEMSRLLKMPVAEIEADRIPLVKEAARRWQAIIVLKGPHSLIACPDGQVYINLSGNPGMATAGSGDVLPGTIAAMYGLGLPLAEAVRKGVFIHGLAGDIAALDKGADGITARDIMESLPEALKQDRQGIDPVLAEAYEVPSIL